MKVVNGNDISVRSGNMMFEDSVEMEISQSGLSNLAFLLTNLYQDPELAVIREYIANGLDAHTVSGTLHPVVVYPPSEEVPELRITDKGSGMSKDTVLNVYSKYGESTKNSNNDEIGGFGLGCKAGLAVASQFTVNTTKDGWNTLAIVQRTDSGKPTLNVVSYTKTDAPNGTTVSIPIKPSYNFNSKLSKFMMFVDKGKVVFGDNAYSIFHTSYKDIPSISEVFISEKYGSSIEFITSPPSGQGIYSGSVYVVMGSIYYEVDSELIASNLSDDNKKYSDIFRNFATVINAPIGVVSLTPNRESLRFDDRTVKFFNDIIGDIFTSAVEADEEKISAASTYVEAYELYHKSMLPRLGVKSSWGNLSLSRRVDCVIDNIVSSPAYYPDTNLMYYNMNKDNPEYTFSTNITLSNYSNRTWHIVVDTDYKTFKKNAKAFASYLYSKSDLRHYSPILFIKDGLDASVGITDDWYEYRRSNTVNKTLTLSEVNDFIGEEFIKIYTQDEFTKLASDFRSSSKGKELEDKTKRLRKTEESYLYYVISDNGRYRSKGSDIQNSLAETGEDVIMVLNGSDEDHDYFAESCRSNVNLMKHSYDVFNKKIIFDDSMRKPDTIKKSFKEFNITYMTQKEFSSKVLDYINKLTTKTILEAFSVLSATGIIYRHTFVDYCVANNPTIKDPLLRKTINTCKKVDFSIFQTLSRIPTGYDHKLCKRLDSVKVDSLDIERISGYIGMTSQYGSELGLKLSNTVYDHHNSKKVSS